MQQSVQVSERRTVTLAEFSDAHCHATLFEKPSAVISEAKERGVALIITAGGNATDNMDCIRIAEANRIFAVVGISPDFAAVHEGQIRGIKELVKSSKSIIGIGEIGLDSKISVEMELQKRIFREQLRIAKDLDLPVVIHSRGASYEVVKILEEEHVKRAMFHFFEGDAELAAQLAAKGYLISIPPVLGKGREEVIKRLKLENLVTETDSPVVGKTPVDAIGVCRKIAAIKAVAAEIAAEKIANNLRNLFYI